MLINSRYRKTDGRCKTVEAEQGEAAAEDKPAGGGGVVLEQLET